MELVEGVSLAELLHQRGRLRPAESANLLEPIARALAAATPRIVHRDVKPSNLLLRTVSPGAADSVQIEALDHPVVPLLTDFGIARALDAPELTSVGRTVGIAGLHGARTVYPQPGNRRPCGSLCPGRSALPLSGRASPFRRCDPTDSARGCCEPADESKKRCTASFPLAGRGAAAQPGQTARGALANANKLADAWPRPLAAPSGVFGLGTEGLRRPP
jgi:serine/threonine protein kinase